MLTSQKGEPNRDRGLVAIEQQRSSMGRSNEEAATLV